MKIKSKTIHMRKSKFFKFVVAMTFLAVFIKLLSYINIEDGLYTLANNEELSGVVINSVLSKYEPDTSLSQLIMSQSPLLTEKNDETHIVSYTPWKLQTRSANTLPVKPLSVNPTSPKGYVTTGKIFLKNSSSKSIDLDWCLNSPLPFTVKDNGAQVLIVHTHGSESYLPSARDYYTPEDVDRTTDTRYNVVRVGDEIESILKSKGISVIHDRNIYDSPTYSGSYTRALNSITNYMKKNPSIRVILDIHRDSICSEDGTKYKTIASVNGKDCAQLMLVLSTGESGLPHPNWQKNLIFGVKLQGQIANKYPGLMRPINLRRERFNMHVTTGSLLVEVGSTGHTLEEALIAIRPFSEELAALLLSAKK